MKLSRRAFLKVAAALVPIPAFAQGAPPRVVVIGGGFAGASFARALRQADRRIAVTLVEANPTFTACPFSNAVIGGLRELSAQQFTYERVAADGIVLARGTAAAVDAQARSVTLADGIKLFFKEQSIPSTARTVPSSVANRKRAKPLLPFWLTTKSEALPLNTAPVGPPATVTVRACFAPAPLYSVEVFVPLLAAHHGVAGPAASPHPLISDASVAGAGTAAESDTRVWTL